MCGKKYKTVCTFGDLVKLSKLRAREAWKRPDRVTYWNGSAEAHEQICFLWGHRLAASYSEASCLWLFLGLGVQIFFRKCTSIFSKVSKRTNLCRITRLWQPCMWKSDTSTIPISEHISAWQTPEKPSRVKSPLRQSLSVCRHSPGPKLQNMSTNLVLLKKKYKLETRSLIARASMTDTNTTVQFSVQFQQIGACYGLTSWATQHHPAACSLPRWDWEENRNIKSENSWAEIKTIL